jgi:O-acetylserine/cysteine efflux transporter
MPLRDRIAAALMVVIWGMNFVAMKFSLDVFPPLMLGAIRFAFVAFPAVLFVPRPKTSIRLLCLYGLTISFGQFAFVFSAIHVGMPTGLASLVLQTQAFISLGISALVFGDRLRASNFVGLALAFAGLALLMTASVAGHGVTLAGFLLTLCGATSWATGNIVTKTIGRVDTLGLVAWGALFPVLPFLACSLLLEGGTQVFGSFSQVALGTVASIAYLSFGASLVGYSIWGHLIASHPVWKIAPLTLLVPIVGLLSGWVVLGERLDAIQIGGCAIILFGLVVNIFGAQLGPITHRMMRRTAS